MSLPKNLQSALWSYDLKRFNIRNEKDRKIIIEQVLNHGTWEQLKWLFKTYSEKEIKEVVKSPSRGTWQEDAMNYWTRYFGLKTPSKNFFFSLKPQN